MNDDIFDAGTPTPEPQAAPSAAPVSEDVQPSLESFLAEFERETAPKEQAAPSQPEQPAQQAPNALAEDSLFGPLSALDGDTLQRRISHAEQMMHAMAERERFRVDSSDFDTIVARADAMVKDLGKAVDDDFTRRWLMAESLTPGIKELFDSRHHSAEHLRQWQRAEKKMLSRLATDAKKIPDGPATADRLAVIQAMKGGGHPPAEKPADVTQMSDPEFRNLLRKRGVG
jgi:hypothetical protein